MGRRLSPCPGPGCGPGAELDMSELSTVLGPSTALSTCWNSLPPATGACQTLDLGPDGTRGRGGLKASRGTETSLQSW